MIVKKHSLYYSLLISVLIGGLFFIVGAKADKSLQLNTFILITIFYISIGIVHHKLEHDLHTKVVIEYVLMGLLGIAIMLFLLQ